MNSNENDVYEARSYGAQSIGFGEKPGIAVVDFQLGFTDPDHSLGGSALVQRAISNSARLLNVARECGVPVANCYTGYSSARDKPYWKITAVLEGFIDGDHSTQFDPRTYNKEYDVAMRKSGASMFFQTPAAAFFNKEGVDTIILLGCVTSGCVRASIVDSFQWGFRTLVPEDCVGDQHERPHWDNLRDVSRRYCDLTTADAMIDAITNWRRNKNQ
ncbi:MAG: isochorismatase family protein [Arenicellales bacterium]|nr:isochorismatase family protein [Arenicellales bacterium]